jgi:hypothetical protein
MARVSWLKEGGSMSTRLRVVLKYPSGVMSTGSKAVKELLILTHPQTSNMALDKVMMKLGGMSKIEKIRVVSEKLPHGYTLTLFQEPRRTRKNRSLYWQKRIDNNQPQAGGIA